MGKSQCIAGIVILSPSQRTPMVKSSTILNPSLIFFCPQGSATPYKRQRAGFCTYALFSRMVQRWLIVRVNLAVASSKFR